MQKITLDFTFATEVVLAAVARVTLLIGSDGVGFGSIFVVLTGLESTFTVLVSGLEILPPKTYINDFKEILKKKQHPTYLPPAKRSLGQGNVFTRVCHFVHGGVGGSLYDVTSCLAPCSFWRGEGGSVRETPPIR